jgi:hypothetical protein
VTNALIGLRTLLDPTFTPLNKPQNVLQTSAAYGGWLAGDDGGGPAQPARSPRRNRAQSHALTWP